MVFRDSCVRRAGRISRAHAAAAIALLAAQSWSGTAHASVTPKPKPSPKPPALNIAIDNGHTSVRQGDRLTYTIKIANTGAAATPVLRVFQALVPGLELISSTPAGTVTAKNIEWNKSLAAGEKAEFNVTAEVGELEAQLQRLTVVACAADKSSERSIVCAAHSDRVPAAGGPVQSQVPGTSASEWYIAVGGLGLLVATGVFVGWRLRRRKPARAPMAP
ncbi:hypothetical protein Aph01nite_37610 [Acrocarpospora phusangensis]|uniref:DUF11 domain-containing protein n=1 Tax=Acrocarpospora phusangensis TaxID=1070424 RepID=A0A919QAW6_9ACTN|nr:DUF11 domain-containing protein [Acrocarpospora phusangensis]GIH25451.1 hypothetical protein Aph01nite_37610 [Acrocarpospora phusangensis]